MIGLTQTPEYFDLQNILLLTQVEGNIQRFLESQDWDPDFQEGLFIKVYENNDNVNKLINKCTEIKTTDGTISDLDTESYQTL